MLTVYEKIEIGRLLYDHGIYIRTEQFVRISKEKLREFFKDFLANEDGKTTVFDGRTGLPIPKVVIGWKSELRLNHLVKDKFNVRSNGPYSLITLQPPGGKSKDGGQRFGEMEQWSIQAFGAAFNSVELSTIKSDDFKGRKDVYMQFVKNKTYSLILMNFAKETFISESFRSLVLEFAAAGFVITAHNSEGEQIDVFK